MLLPLLLVLLNPAVVEIGGGVAGMFPAGSVRASLAAPVEIEARYLTLAGLVHDFGVGARYPGEGWDLRLDVAHGFYAIEDLGGIDTAPAPFGNGTTSTLEARSWLQARRVRVALGGGATLRWLRLRERLGTVERVFEPTLHHVHGLAEGHWPGGFFIRLSALVPIQADFKILGYLPTLTLGRAWSL